MTLSVIIPTHNPRYRFLGRVLDALKAQSLKLSEWELLVVDNASKEPVKVDLSWHSQGRIIVEPQLGLTRTRLRGFSEARGDIAVLVDDDNVLDPSYLENAAELFASKDFLGTCSGSLTLEYEDPALRPPKIYERFLTTRSVESPVWSNDPTHNDSTPWGAGMCVRRPVFESYQLLVRSDPRRNRLDLQGTSLVYGGDTDIAFHGCAIGFGKGVFPSLRINHLIPKERCDIANLLRSAEGQAYSQILHGHLTHGRIGIPRKDFLGRMSERVRLLLSSEDERRIAAAYSRGYERARREFSGAAT